MTSKQQAVFTSRYNRMMCRLTRAAHQMHVPRCMFDYSLTLLIEVPLLSPDRELASGYKVRPASIHDIPALATCRQTDDPTVGAKLFKTRFDQDARCYLVLDTDNHLFGYAWVMRTGNLFEDDDRLRITCHPDGAYIFDTFLHPDAREKGLYPLLITGLQQDMATQGKTEFHILANQSNAIGIKAHQTMGAKLCETCMYTTILGLSWYFLKTSTKQKTFLKRFHTHHPCDSLILHPLDPRSFSLSIIRIEQESTMKDALTRIRACEGQNIETNTPFNNGEITYIWWKSDIKDREPLFLIEVLQPKTEPGTQTVAYGFFRLHETSKRFLHPRELIAFDDVYFMNTTLLTRTRTILAIDIRHILSLSKNVRQIQHSTGADVVTWHRLPPSELDSLTRARASRWKTVFETEYPILDGLATNSPLESATAEHALRDLTKQGKRLQNKFQSKPETTCLVLNCLDEIHKQFAFQKFLSILDTSWQHEWMEKNDGVDYEKFQEKLLAYTDFWIKQNQMRLYITQVAGIDMAYLYTLQIEHSCWCIMTGFNPLLKTYSPGKSVFIAMLNQTWDSGIREYYLGGNVLGWKEAWLTRCLPLYTMELWLDSGKALAHRFKLLIRS